MRKTALCVGASLFLSLAAHAATLSVATTGSASGTGTTEQPFDRLETALAKAHAGDTIVIHGGTYLKTHAVVALEGTAEAPIVIEAAPGEAVVLDGKDAFGVDEKKVEDKSRTGIVDLRSSRYVTVEGLEVTNSDGYGISTWESENITVRKCKIHETYSRGLGGTGAHLVFEDNEIFDTAMANKDEAVLKAAEKGQSGFWSAAAATWYRLDGRMTTDVTWRRNKIHDSWGEGLIALHVDGALIEHNEVYDTYSGLIYIDHSRNVRVDSNFVGHRHHELVRRDVKDVSPAIMFAAEEYKGTPPLMPENLVITNNIIANTQVGIGFWRDPENKSPTNRYRNVVIANNVIVNASLLPISIKEINAEGLGESRNILANNVIYSAIYLLEGLDEPVAVLIKNPELWQVEHNVFPNGLSGVLFQNRFRAFEGNIVADPHFADPRAVSRLGPAGFIPRAKSRLWRGGIALPEVTKDFDGKSVSGSTRAIGVFSKQQ